MRLRHGGGGGDYTARSDFTPDPSQPIYVWRADSGGSPELDVLPAGGTAVDPTSSQLLSAPLTGNVEVDGPDGYGGSLYWSRSLAGPRSRLTGPTDGLATQSYVAAALAGVPTGGGVYSGGSGVAFTADPSRPNVLLLSPSTGGSLSQGLIGVDTDGRAYFDPAGVSQSAQIAVDPDGRLVYVSA